jgi:hypothetical protein
LKVTHATGRQAAESDASDSGRPPAVWGRLESAVFDSRPALFCTALLGIGLIRSGIWWDPATDDVRRLATDPFSNPFGDGGNAPVMYRWLTPLLAWVLHANSRWTFVGMQLMFAVAGTLLFYRTVFSRLSDHAARVACLVFFLLPLATHSYYWIGTDSVTIFLVIAAFAVAPRPAGMAFIGVLLGLQDFELGVLAAGAALIAAVLHGSPRRPLDRVTPSLTLVGGVVAGRLALEATFSVADVDVARPGGNVLRSFFPSLLGQDLVGDLVEMIAKSPFTVIWSTLGLGWVVVLLWLRRGRRRARLALPVLLAHTLLLLSWEQTRVVSIVTSLTLLLVWVGDEEFLESIDRRLASGLLVVWLLMPWTWAIAGTPQTSATPYTVAYAVGGATGWFDPPDDDAWPFRYEVPSATPGTAGQPAGGSATSDDEAPVVTVDGEVVGTGGEPGTQVAAPLDEQSAANAEPRGVRVEHQVLDGDPPSGDGCCLDVIAPGDVDGDGAVDVVIGAENADGLSWYRNPGGDGAGSWTRRVIGGGSFTTDGDTADMDADGDLDVVASSIDRNVIEWWEQQGDPTSIDGWVRHDIGAEFAHDLAIADIDGDGDLDVAAYHAAAGYVDWFEHPDDPVSEWTAHRVADVPGEGLTAADLDGDGDVDLVGGPAVYTNDDGSGGAWTRTSLTDDWDQQARSAVGDIDGDGLADVALSHPETEGRLSWFQAPSWTEHVIDDDAGYTHTVEIGDIDLDGANDLYVGVMHWAGSHDVRILLGDGGTTWTPIVLASSGTHNGRLVDLDGDGRLDMLGKNFDEAKQVEVWWNRARVAPATSEPTSASASATTPLDDFEYVELDNSRTMFNDATPFFGLTFGDLDADGADDIVAGGYVYMNPGRDISTGWERVDLSASVGASVDAMLITDVDGDDHADIIAEALPDVWWLEVGEDGRTWSGRVVAQVPGTSRPNGQGYRLGDIDGDGAPEIVLSGGAAENEIWSVTVPDEPDAGTWPALRITNQATDEQMGLADIDGDGDNDVVAGNNGADGLAIVWFENPAAGVPDWTLHRIGAFEGVYPDRLELADIDGDGGVDVVVSAEDPTGELASEVVWYRQPEALDDEWDRQVISRGFSTNGMDVADFDGDGDVDVVTGELLGDRRVTIWENVGRPEGVMWVEHLVDSGKESHLGARVHDLDDDGDLDIVSIGFYEPNLLHLWVNR